MREKYMHVCLSQPIRIELFKSHDVSASNKSLIDVGQVTVQSSDQLLKRVASTVLLRVRVRV
jgi:hypothetical protein